MKIDTIHMSMPAAINTLPGMSSTICSPASAADMPMLMPSITPNPIVTAFLRCAVFRLVSQ